MGYQVIVELIKDGVKIGSLMCRKTYKKKGFATRKANSYMGVVYDNFGNEIIRRAYVRGTLTKVTEDEAKTAYCKGKRIWVDTPSGQERIRNSWEYGSHAPATELFYRGVYHSDDYYHEYNGNYYVEYED